MSCNAFVDRREKCQNEFQVQTVEVLSLSDMFVTKLCLSNIDNLTAIYVSTFTFNLTTFCVDFPCIIKAIHSLATIILWVVGQSVSSLHVDTANCESSMDIGLRQIFQISICLRLLYGTSPTICSFWFEVRRLSNRL